MYVNTCILSCKGMAIEQSVGVPRHSNGQTVETYVMLYVDQSYITDRLEQGRSKRPSSHIQAEKS